MTKNDEKIIWLDAETTGISPDSCQLLQVACIVTDRDLNELDSEGFEQKVYYSADEVVELKSTTSEYVINMHDSTNLWNLLPIEGKPLVNVDQNLLRYIQRFISEPKSARLGGNSITLDRNFLAKYTP